MNVVKKITDFMESARRIFTVSKKPSWKEYSMLIKVTGIGILLIALIGYVMYLLFTITGLGR